MGWNMQYLQKKKGWNTPPSEQTTSEHSIDFHVEMIKKIDKLLKDHDLEPPVEEPAPEPVVSAPPPQPPIELREPLHRTPGHMEISCVPIVEPFLMRETPNPEEFRTSLAPVMAPAFRYISSLEYEDNTNLIREKNQDRIEIINLSTFMFEEIPPTTPTFPPFGKKSKIHLINTGTSKGKQWDNAYFAALAKTEQNEKKAQQYYIMSKHQKEKKFKKTEMEQSYIPVDFDERSKKIKEQQKEDEEELEEFKTEEEEKAQKKQQKEEQKMKKQEAKKKPVKEQPKQEPDEEDEDEEPEDIPVPEQSTLSKKELKKKEKEQKKLEKLEAKKAILEEKKRKKAEKQALKEQKKHKGKQPKKEQKIDKQKKSGGFFKKETPEEVITLDDDVRKVLLMTDTLLGELPEDVIDRFTNSEDFELYEKVLNRYKIK